MGPEIPVGCILGDPVSIVWLVFGEGKVQGNGEVLVHIGEEIISSI